MRNGPHGRTILILCLQRVYFAVIHTKKKKKKKKKKDYFPTLFFELSAFIMIVKSEIENTLMST